MLIKSIRISLLLSIMAILPCSWAQSITEKIDDLTAKDIMLLNEKSRKSITEYTDLYMTLTNARGQERKRVMKMRIDDSNFIARKTYIEFISPKDVKGTRILTLEKEDINQEQDRWLYVPALRKTRRIANSDIGESFVGTDFTYEDMEINDGIVGTNNHSYKLIREEDREDALGVIKPCWVIEAIPVTEKRISDSSYSKRIIWIEKEYYTAIQEDYYNKDGEHFKTRTSSDVTKFITAAGKEIWRPNRIEMIDFEKEHKTLIVFDQIIDKPIPSRVFTKRFLQVGL
ncbi:outer membrane lipoprotein-sorting protein [Colwelliaceae bacterium MEBiC 14330]